MLIAAVLALTVATGAQAWWCTGHMTIAEIARENLNSGPRSTVESIISSLNTMGPFPKVTYMTEAGCWADDIRSNNKAMAQWHFLNIPFAPTGYPAHLPPQVENVESVIPQMYDGAKGNHYSKPNNWELVFAVANLIHFYGDIHQPLHVTDLVTSKFPNGDKGGNLLMINVGGNTQDLHGYWDAICNQFVTDPNRPLSSSDRQYIENLAQTFMTNFTFSSEQKAVWNSTVMAQESYQYAVQYSYDNGNLQPGDTLSPTYIANCMQAAGQRVTLAGYRLASELNYIFKDSSKLPEAKHIHERIQRGYKEVREVAKAKYAEIALAAKANKAL